MRTLRYRIADAINKVTSNISLQGAPKVEGIAVQRDADDWVVTMVTDPDDATVASQWLRRYCEPQIAYPACTTRMSACIGQSYVVNR